MEWISSVWTLFLERVTAQTSLPSDQIPYFLSLTAFAASLVLIGPIWRWTSYLITVVHEGGHALAALLVGSKLQGIKIRWDRSGETLTLGSTFLPLRMWTTWWGYPAPAALGCFYLWAVFEGRQGLAITFTLIMSFVMFLQIRSFMAFLTITGSGIATACIWWWLPATPMAFLIYFFGWFLLFGAVGSLGNLTRLHWRGQASGSDALSLRSMTLVVPAVVWLLTFWCAISAGVFYSGYLLWSLING